MLKYSPHYCILHHSRYPAPFPELCGKVVCKITIGQPCSHQPLRNIWFLEHYVLAGKPFDTQGPYVATWWQKKHWCHYCNGSHTSQSPVKIRCAKRNQRVFWVITRQPLTNTMLPWAAANLGSFHSPRVHPKWHPCYLYSSLPFTRDVWVLVKSSTL